jgi:general L-amino acid transport system permease protein
MWGGSIWVSFSVLVGFLVGYGIIKVFTERLGQLPAIVLAVLSTIIWWSLLGPLLATALGSIFPIALEPVVSRDFGGFLLALLIGVVAIGCSLPIGIILALARQSDLLIVKAISVGFIEFIRGVPLITLLFVASTLLNIFLPPGSDFDIILRVIIMVTLFASAYMAEVIRGGLAALPRGQYEGADSLGLDYWQAQRLIIMPQALKISIPGIVSTFIGLFKDTTLVSIIGLMDPLGLSQGIRANAEWNGIYWELFAFIALLFFIVCFSMSRYSMYLERKLQTDHS